MSADVREVIYGKREAGETTHVHFVGGSTVAVLTELLCALSTYGS